MTSSVWKKGAGLVLIVLMWMAPAAMAGPGKQAAGPSKRDQPLAGPEVGDSKAGGGQGMMAPGIARRFSGQRRGGHRRGGAGMNGHGVLRQVLGKMDLTEAQKKRVQATAKAFGQRLAAWRKEHQEQLKTLRSRFQEARKQKDRPQLRDLGERWHKLRADAPKVDELVKQIKATLTPQQVKRFDELYRQAMKRAAVTDRGKRKQGRPGRHRKRHHGKGGEGRRGGRPRNQLDL